MAATTRTHREQYPEQYRHALVGQRVQIRQHGHDPRPPVEGIVQRVMSTRWGLLVDLGLVDEKGAPIAWHIADCMVVTP